MTSRPVKPDREAVFLRLLVEAADGQTGTELALRAAVETQLDSDAAGSPWRVARLFGPPGTEEERGLARFFEVTGHVVASPTYPPHKLAFDLARELAEAANVRVDPDLPSSAFEPPPGAMPSPEARGVFSDDRPPHPAAAARNWARVAIRCPEAWALQPPPGGAAMGAGIAIGHPDTGYTEHVELEAGALDLGRDRDVIADDDDALDPLERRRFWLDQPGHGTATGSVIIGRPAGDLGGVAPRATLVPIRTVKSVVQVFDGDVAKAIDHARRVGCGVISMSLGGVGFSRALGEAITAAVQHGMIVLAAAGNYVGFVTAPATDPNCLAIAATNAVDEPWSYSSHGSAVDFSAPGQDVWVAIARPEEGPPRRAIGQSDGTSFAVAHAAGAAALWLAHHGRDSLIERYGAPNVQRVFLELVSRSSRKPPGWDEREHGVGILDAEALLRAPLPDHPRESRLAAARPVERDTLARINEKCPELSREELSDRLAEGLGVEPAELEAGLERVGGELAYLLNEDRGLREHLVRPEATALSGERRAPLVNDLRSAGSRSLLAQLGLP